MRCCAPAISSRPGSTPSSRGATTSRSATARSDFDGDRARLPGLGGQRRRRGRPHQPAGRRVLGRLSLADVRRGRLRRRGRHRLRHRPDLDADPSDHGRGSRRRRLQADPRRQRRRVQLPQHASVSSVDHELLRNVHPRRQRRLHARRLQRHRPDRRHDRRRAPASAICSTATSRSTPATHFTNRWSDDERRGVRPQRDPRSASPDGSSRAGAGCWRAP